MYEKIEPIADSIRRNINQVSHSLEEFDRYIGQLLSQNIEKKIEGLHFLLNITCQYNLIHQLHALLELNVLSDINQSLKLSAHHSFGLFPQTLLGIAAFHGHQEMVRYLIDVQGADENGTDCLGNTPLHQVVYGDSHPYNHASIGSSHDLVADDLLFRYSADLTLKNNEQSSAYEECLRARPWKIELLLSGKRLISTGSAFYYGDKVRPAIERKQAQLDWANRMNAGRKISMIVLRDSPCDKQPFEQFRTDFAIEAHIRRDKITMGFKDLHDLVTTILALPEAEWQHAISIINTFKPEPNSGFRFPNENNIRHGILTGMLVIAIVYILLESTELALGIGLISMWLSTMTFMNQTTAEKTQKSHKEMDRAEKLESFFFPAKQPRRFSSGSESSEHHLHVETTSLNL